MFPSVSTLLAKWIPAKERSTVGSLVYTGAQIGTVTGNLITAEVMYGCRKWTYAYYFWGALAGVWYVVFFIFCTSEPADHPHISEAEAAYLNESIGESKSKAHRLTNIVDSLLILGGPVRRPKIPWKAILSSIPIWGLILGEIGHDIIYFLVITNFPKYMSNVLKYDIQQMGFAMAAPFLVLFVTAFLCGITADLLIKREIVSVLNVRRWFTFVGGSPSLLLSGFHKLLYGYTHWVSLTLVELPTLVFANIGRVTNNGLHELR